MASDGTKQLHIAMFPWLAFGHMIPWLELAKLIAQKRHRISFISTPRNIARLPKPPPNLSPFLNFITVPLPHVENLPEYAEATSDLSVDGVWYLKKAYDLLQEPMTCLLQSLDPDWLLYDFPAHWLPPIARKLYIPNGFFSIFTAAALSYISPPSDRHDYRACPEDYAVVPKWIPFSSTVSYRHFEADKVYHSIVGDESNISNFYRFREALKGCDVIAVRSCFEFEPEWLKLLEVFHQKPVIPVGELPTTANNSDDENDASSSFMKEWLDKQEKGSVVYVAFGSEAKPSQGELTELALGLELSELPFFWVLKTRYGSADTELLHLPEGFEERTQRRGVVWTSWAPQLRILAHDSVGGFLTHSGWSSVVEALQFEKALIMWTFHADQGLNAKLLEEKKIGYLIPRDEQDGSFTRNSVAQSLRFVIVEEEGKIYRQRAKEMRGLFGDRERQDKYVNSLLYYLESNRRLEKENHEATGSNAN